MYGVAMYPNGRGVMVWKVGEMEKLQKIENTVWRQILGAPSCAALEAVRGDVGYSTVIERDMKAKLIYLNYIMNNSSSLLHKVMILKRENISNQWMKTINRYLGQLRMSWNTLGESNKDNIKREIMKWGEGRWRTHMEDKHTLETYRLYKQEIKEEGIYSNTFASVLLFRARSNCLKLGWRERFTGGNETCLLCQSGEVESLAHFLVECPTLEAVRGKYFGQNIQLGTLLLFMDQSPAQVERSKACIEEMWRVRRMRLEAM